MIDALLWLSVFACFGGMSILAGACLLAIIVVQAIDEALSAGGFGPPRRVWASRRTPVGERR